MEQLKLSDLLEEKLIYFDVEADNRENLLVELAGKLYEKGYVKNTYANAILEREKQYPTGLPTKIVKIAVPHTDIEHVNKPCVLIAGLKKPVDFKDMGNGKDDIAVELVFMLSVNKPKEHLIVLQQIIGLFSDEETLMKIKNARCPKSMIEVIREGIYKKNKQYIE
jgi:PTS system galactitol-specific IIA component